jgi:signal peptidase I
MFGFFGDRKLRKARKQAKEWFQLARKIEHFRRDVLTKAEHAELGTRMAALQAALKAPEASVREISEAVEALEKTLRAVGGDFYPRSWITENVDMIVVAAIVAIGVRTFFLQPFKIPTNSMYPTYHGLTTEVYVGGEQPSRLARGWRVLQLGAGHRTVEGAPGEELIIPLTAGSEGNRGVILWGDQAGGYLPGEFHPSARFQRFFVLNGPAVDYTFIVGETPVVVRVPSDFPMNHVLKELVREMGGKVEIERNRFGYQAVIRTGLKVPADGSPVLSFDVKSGDMLFVDRFSYHFRGPRVGEPFVFNTTSVPTMEPASEKGKYYIKRIAGGPGDTLRVEHPVLFRNGEPADAAEAFLRNARQEGEYEGYLPHAGRPNRYPLERPLTLPENAFFALGDNSDESADSRAWGYVPTEAIIGRAIFIYYPFSRRWGLAE